MWWVFPFQDVDASFLAEEPRLHQAVRFEGQALQHPLRLTRSDVRGVLFTLEQLKSWGVQYRSMQESYLDNLGPYNDVVVLLLSTIAKLERERIRERTLAGLSRARKEGRIGGRPPGDADTKLVTHIHRLKAAGKSIREIAEEAGTSRSTVQRLLAAA
jgi:DNA invertase Pin-like site-specific DNA recombinase